MATASVSFTTPTQPDHTYKNYTFFSATTTTATSTNTTDGGGYFVIAGAKKLMLYFTHGGTATTSTTGQVFRVQTSPDGVTWNYFNHMIDSTVSSTATSSVTVQAATSTAMVTVDLTKDAFYAIRVISTEMAAPLGTDGEATAAASAEF